MYRSQFPSPKDFAESALEGLKLGFNAVKFDIDYATLIPINTTGTTGQPAR